MPTRPFKEALGADFQSLEEDLLQCQACPFQTCFARKPISATLVINRNLPVYFIISQF